MDTKVKCLPVYVMIDTSKSMTPYESMLNQGIEALYDELITNPSISEFAHVSIISFNTEAELVLEITGLQSMPGLPNVTCGGITNFGGAIQFLRDRIDQDVPRLKSTGHQVLRPVAFLLTDGLPTDMSGRASDAWRADYAGLVDRAYSRHPNVVPFGYGDATPQFLKEIATIPDAAFLAKDGGTGSAIQKVIPALLNTLVASARDSALRLPAEVEGYIRVSEEIL